MSRKFLVEFPFEQTWERLKIEINLKNLNELVDIIGISQSVVSKRKKENIFPVEWAYIVSKKKNLNIDWILEGTGPVRPGDQEGKKLELEFLADIGKWLQNKEEIRPEVYDWFKFEFKERFPEFPNWNKKEKNNDEDREDNSIQEANIA